MSQGKRVPKWMMHYDKVIYVILVIDALYSIAYLSYIGYVMNDRKMYLPYNSSRLWLELNSYSLLPPFFAVPVAPILAWQVKNRIELSDGDFYGIVGTMLGLGATSLFNAYKTMHIYTNTTHDVEGIREAMHNGVRGEVYTDFVYSITIVNDNGQVVSLLYENEKDGHRFQRGNEFIFVEKNNRVLPTQATWTDPVITDKGIRFWTHSVQHDLECCGSENYTEWEVFNGQFYRDDDHEADKQRQKYGPYPPSCYCKYSCSKDLTNHEDCFKDCEISNSTNNLKIIKSRPGCHGPYMKMLRSTYLNTFILMLILGTLYIVTMLAFVVNFAVVRLSRQQEVEDDNLFALLRSTSDENSTTQTLQRRSNKYLHKKYTQNGSINEDLNKGVIRRRPRSKRRLKNVHSSGVRLNANKVAPLMSAEKTKTNAAESPKSVLERNLGVESALLKIKSNKGNTNLSHNDQGTENRGADKTFKQRIGSITSRKKPLKGVSSTP